MKVYVCTSGHYSDYGIAAIFSTREKAEAFNGPNGNEIEEFELDEDERRPVHGWCWRFHINDGAIYFNNKEPRPEFRRIIGDSQVFGDTWRNVFASSREACVKITTECLQEMQSRFLPDVYPMFIWTQNWQGWSWEPFNLDEVES